MQIYSSRKESMRNAVGMLIFGSLIVAAAVVAWVGGDVPVIILILFAVTALLLFVCAVSYFKTARNTKLLVEITEDKLINNSFNKRFNGEFLWADILEAKYVYMPTAKEPMYIAIFLSDPVKYFGDKAKKRKENNYLDRSADYGDTAIALVYMEKSEIGALYDRIRYEIARAAASRNGAYPKV